MVDTVLLWPLKLYYYCSRNPLFIRQIMLLPFNYTFKSILIIHYSRVKMLTKNPRITRVGGSAPTTQSKNLAHRPSRTSSIPQTSKRLFLATVTASTNSKRTWSSSSRASIASRTTRYCRNRRSSALAGIKQKSLRKISSTFVVETRHIKASSQRIFS